MIKEVLQQLEPLDAQIDALCSRADDAEMASTTTHAAELAELSAEENRETMIREMERVKTGQVTYAVRDTVIDDKEIKQDDYMGIGDKGILSVGTDMEKTVLEMIGEMIDEDSAILSIYYGEEMNEDSANEIAEKVEEEYPDVEVEVHYGGQPIYYYVISVE